MPGRGDPDRQDPRAGRVARRCSSAGRRRRSPAAPDGRSSPPECSAASRAVARHQPTRTSSIVHGNGERASMTSPWRASRRSEPALGEVVDVARRVARARAGTRRGPRSAPATAARAAPTRAGGGAPRAPSRRPCARGRARARAPRSRRRGRTRRRRTAGVSAGIVAELEVRRGGASPTRPGAWGPRGRVPTTRRVAEALAPTGRSARPRRSRRRAPTAGRRARTARRACPRKPAISRRTTGLVEPYLSNVLPVGTASPTAHTSSASRSAAAGRRSSASPVAACSRPPGS